MIISGHYDYSDPMVQQQVENLTSTLESLDFIGPYTESWLRSFQNHIEFLQDDYNLTISNEADFVQNLKDRWLFPNNTFSLDVKFDDSEQHIIASRFMIQAVNVSGTNQEKAVVKKLRQVCQDSPLNASVFQPYFVFFDQYELVGPTSIQSMIYGAIVMMLICLLFIPNVFCCFWVAFCIVSIEIGVAGYMSLWGVSLDSISMINLIMCIGFSVDFTAHICYAYMSSKKERPDDKVRDCLYALGLPIVQGALSTILGLVALLLAETYIFLVFFKMVFLVIFIGAMHGLFLLPVLLSLFGPGSWGGSEKKEDFLEKMPKTCVIPHPKLHVKQDSFVPFEDKDLGLGTSEDSNSTESGSSQSRRKHQDQKRYEGWGEGLGQYEAPPPDYPGAENYKGSCLGSPAFRTVGPNTVCHKL